MINLPGYKSHEELKELRLKRKKPRAPAVQAVSEDTIHTSIAAFLEATLPKSVLWWHTPNGGKRGITVAMKMKRMGTKPGVPDLIILWGGRTGFIEVKNAKGTLSSDQKAFRDKAVALGHPYAVVRSIDDTQAVLKEWGVI